MINFYPEERNSLKINSDMAMTYTFPNVNAGEAFDFEIKSLFPGYYKEDLFVGFLILSE
jgi:hypothetical protein